MVARKIFAKSHIFRGRDLRLEGRTEAGSPTPFLSQMGDVPFSVLFFRSRLFFLLLHSSLLRVQCESWSWAGVCSRLPLAERPFALWSPLSLEQSRGTFGLVGEVRKKVSSPDY